MLRSTVCNNTDDSINLLRKVFSPNEGKTPREDLVTLVINPPGSRTGGGTVIASTNVLLWHSWLGKNKVGATGFSPAFSFCVNLLRGLLRDQKLIHTWQTIPRFCSFISETTSPPIFTKSYQNPLRWRAQLPVDSATLRIPVAKEKCLKTHVLPDCFHLNTQGSMHKLHAKCFSTQFCLEESMHSCALCPHTHKIICTTSCPAMKKKKEKIFCHIYF